MKLQNAYAAELGALFEKTPKAVFAALAVSYAINLRGAEDPAVELLAEWRALHENGIIPQAPPREVSSA